MERASKILWIELAKQRQIRKREMLKKLRFEIERAVRSAISKSGSLVRIDTFLHQNQRLLTRLGLGRTARAKISRMTLRRSSQRRIKKLVTLERNKKIFIITMMLEEHRKQLKLSRAKQYLSDAILNKNITPPERNPKISDLFWNSRFNSKQEEIKSKKELAMEKYLKSRLERGV